MSNRLHAFEESARKNPLAGIIKGEEMGKSFLDRVAEITSRVRKDIESKVSFSVSIRSNEKDFNACKTDTEREELSRRVADRNKLFIPVDVRDDEDERAAYVMAFANILFPLQ